MEAGRRYRHPRLTDPPRSQPTAHPCRGLHHVLMARDPWLDHPTWRAARAHWERQVIDYNPACQATRCQMPGVSITTTPGQPNSLDVGHITSRYHARRAQWTAEQCNAISNTRPEHARCGRSDGATLGNNNRHGNGVRIPLERDLW
jgi:hypothetical protein